MDWNMVGAIGETLGAAGVIITLGYLAVQIRSNTRQSRATMTQNIVDGVNGVHHAVMVNPQFAAVMAKVSNGENLDEAERMQWVSATNRAFNIYSAVQRAHDHGQIEQSFYNMYCLDIARASSQFGWAQEMRELLKNFPEEAKMKIFEGLYE